MACKQHHQGLLGAAGSDHVVGADELLVVLLGIANDGFLQGGNAVGRCVPDFSGVEQADAIDDGIDRDLALWFAASQMNDGLSFIAKQSRGFIQLESRRLPDGPGKLTKTHDVYFLPSVY